MLTSAFNHLLCFNLMRCAKKVSNLINHPVVCLFGTRVGGTRFQVVSLGVIERDEPFLLKKKVLFAAE
jgi:hypothetical protein